MFFIIKLKHIIFAAACIIILSTLSIGACFTFKNSEADGISVPILMYHHILKDPARHGSYVISPDEFEADLKFLKESGYTAVTISDLIKYVNGEAALPEKPVILTFDDGYLSALEYAFPLLKKYEMKAVISIIAKESEEYSKSGDRHVPYAHLSWEDLILMRKSGIFEVQNHTYDMHKNKKGERCGTKKVSGESAEHYAAEFKKDVGTAQQLLLKNAEVNATCFTYPFGMISKESVALVKEMGFSSSLSCFEGINYITPDPDSLYLLKRYNRAHKRSAQEILN